jgi:exonuclease III
MSILVWNCRGLGSDSTVGELRWLVKHFRPAFLFLSEMKMKDKVVQRFMWSLGYSGSLAVSCEGLSGGLALFWLQPFSVSLKGLNAHCINVVVSADSGDLWRATFVYGEPRRDKRHEFWDLLHRLHDQWKGPWICCGDFNEVLTHDEHYGSTVRSDAQMLQFRLCL